MSDRIEVKPTPIQRNEFDVAVELTQLYCSRFAIDNVEELEQLFSRFYSLAKVLHFKRPMDLQNLVSSDIVEKIGHIR